MMAGSPLSDFLFSLLMVTMLTVLRDALRDKGLTSTWNRSTDVCALSGERLPGTQFMLREASFVDDAVVPIVVQASEIEAKL